MKRIVSAAITMMLLCLPLTVLAQSEEVDEEQELSPIAFQGRVGAVYTGGEPFQNGATFEVNALIHMQGPLYANIFAGISNFEAEGEIVPFTDEFIAYWEQFNEIYEVLNVDELRYRMNFVGVGATAILSAGKLQPLITGGVGAYQVRFVTSFSFVDRQVPEEFIDEFTIFTSLEDSKWFLGYNAGAGLYYKFNQIINFGGQVTYHIIDTDAVEDQISFTAGLHIRIP